MTRGEPSVSNCLRASAVARTPAWLRACWIASSVSSMERLSGMWIWMVTAFSWRSMRVADISRLPEVGRWTTPEHREGKPIHQDPVVLLLTRAGKLILDRDPQTGFL